MIDTTISNELYDGITQRWGRFGETHKDFETILRRALKMESGPSSTAPTYQVQHTGSRGIVKYTEQIIGSHPELSNKEIAELVLRQFPDANTTNKSVASIRYQLNKQDLSQ
jgi:hypothetical protein